MKLTQKLGQIPIPSPDNPRKSIKEYRASLPNALALISCVDSELLQEQLVPHTDYDLCGRDYYHEKFLETRFSLFANENPPTTRNIWLRKEIMKDLQRIDDALKQDGVSLFLLSGFRSRKLQDLIRHISDHVMGNNHTSLMLADPELHLPHATGAAIDLELIDVRTGALLPTKIKSSAERDYLENKKQLTLDEEDIRNNRRILHHALTSPFILSQQKCFIGHPFEYWHYARNEKLASIHASFYSVDHEVLYDYTSLPEQGNA
jgi:D-alanyl-D-alanine dipeptidase